FHFQDQQKEEEAQSSFQHDSINGWSFGSEAICMLYKPLTATLKKDIKRQLLLNALLTIS
ncbi:hypothetical protein L9F63_027693, partial [Diploptera punctata]